MEKPLDRQLEELVNCPGVRGVMCADMQGFCVANKGSVSAQSAGVVASLSEQAANLHPEEKVTPVIVIESDAGNLCIKQNNNIAMAILKNSS